MSLIDTKYLAASKYASPDLTDAASESFISFAEIKYLLPVLTRQLYDDISTSPFLYENLLAKYIAPCLCDYALLSLYNRFTADNAIFSISDQLRRDVIADLSASAAFKLKELSNHLNTGIYPFYIDPAPVSNRIGGVLRSIPPVPVIMPYAKVRIEIPEDNTTYESAWDDSAWFPDYIDSNWNYDFNAFLVSLGKFLFSWGDGTKETINFYNQSCSHIYTVAGHYTVTVFSIYAFFSDASVTAAGNLFRLKNLNFANCANLLDTPVLTGLSYLQVLDLRATGITVAPDTTGLTGLQYLHFNSTAISAPPDLTTNINMKYLSFHGCSLLTVQPFVSKLSRLEHLDLYGTSLTTNDLNDILYSLYIDNHPNISSVDLRVSHAAVPDSSFIAAFHAAYPLADLYTN